VPLTLDEIRAAPKVLLHDHLDGGLRPGTIVDLARERGYGRLPSSDPDAIARWLCRGANRGHSSSTLTRSSTRWR
jgi:adenosine deaminase